MWTFLWFGEFVMLILVQSQSLWTRNILISRRYNHIGDWPNDVTARGKKILVVYSSCDHISLIIFTPFSPLSELLRGLSTDVKCDDSWPSISHLPMFILCNKQCIALVVRRYEDLFTRPYDGNMTWWGKTKHHISPYIPAIEV